MVGQNLMGFNLCVVFDWLLGSDRVDCSKSFMYMFLSSCLASEFLECMSESYHDCILFWGFWFILSVLNGYAISYQVE